MNQQRSRRFRASKEGVELSDEKARIREEIIQRGWRRYSRIFVLCKTHEDVKNPTGALSVPSTPLTVLNVLPNITKGCKMLLSSKTRTFA